MRHLAGLMVLAMAFAAPIAAAQAADWKAGDAWTYASDLGGAHAITVQGGGLRTSEVEDGPADVRIERTWAAPLKLESEVRVKSHCITVPLPPSTRCGNLTERWTYTPPLEQVRFPLAASATWQQQVHVDYVRTDELGVLNGNSATDEARYFRVVGSGNLTTPAGTFDGWTIAADDEASDLDGRGDALFYAPQARNFAQRTRLEGGQSVSVWTLANLSLQPRAAAGGGGSGGAGGGGGTGSGGTVTGGGSGGGGSVGGTGGGAPVGNATGGGTGGAGGAPGPPATNRTTGAAPAGPLGPERPLRGAPAESLALGLLAALGVAAAARRR